MNFSFYSTDSNFASHDDLSACFVRDLYVLGVKYSYIHFF